MVFAIMEPVEQVQNLVKLLFHVFGAVDFIFVLVFVSYTFKAQICVSD